MPSHSPTCSLKRGCLSNKARSTRRAPHGKKQQITHIKLANPLRKAALYIYFGTSAHEPSICTLNLRLESIAHQKTGSTAGTRPELLQKEWFCIIMHGPLVEDVSARNLSALPSVCPRVRKHNADFRAHSAVDCVHAWAVH